jgi:hypothetical protein
MQVRALIDGARKAASRQRGKPMTLIINNREVEQVLTMEDTMAALGFSRSKRSTRRGENDRVKSCQAVEKP